PLGLVEKAVEELDLLRRLGHVNLALGPEVGLDALQGLLDALERTLGRNLPYGIGWNIFDHLGVADIAVRGTSRQLKLVGGEQLSRDRKSTRLNSSHVKISY